MIINDKDNAEFFNKLVYSHIPTEEEMENRLKHLHLVDWENV